MNIISQSDILVMTPSLASSKSKLLTLYVEDGQTLDNVLPGNLVFAEVFPSSDDIVDLLLSLTRITSPKDTPKCLQ